MSNFDYSSIPNGYYDLILNKRRGLRSFWHYHKFSSVIKCIPSSLKQSNKSLLDVGCFSGTFVGLIDQKMFNRKVGVDILENQIEYAKNQYANSRSEFYCVDSISDIDSIPTPRFDIITVIEVIEHLSDQEIRSLFDKLSKMLKENGYLVITTPNYMSLWPIIEICINLFSNVKYKEQHVTKFNYFNFEKKIRELTDQNDLILEYKSTTHFLSPFIAIFSFSLAIFFSHISRSKISKNPFGSILVSIWKKD